MKTPPWLLTAEGNLTVGQRVTLGAGEARHAVGPLRLKSGARVVLTDGAGMIATGILEPVGRSDVEIRVDGVDRAQSPTSELTLCMAVLASSAMDLVVQKAVELGVRRLVPVCCERSQIGPKRARTRMEHWTRVSRQALKQCRRAWAMEMAPPVRAVDLVEEVGPGGGLLADLDGGRIEDLPRGRRHTLLIGPEGGFTATEERLFDIAGWMPVCLGPHMLRAETAAIAGAALFANLQTGRPLNDG